MAIVHTGVCFVPQGLIVEVLERCEEIDRAEEVWVRKIADGLTIPEFIAAAYEKFPYRKDEK